MNDCTSKIKPAIKMIFCVIIILIYIYTRISPASSLCQLLGHSWWLFHLWFFVIWFGVSLHDMTCHHASLFDCCHSECTEPRFKANGPFEFCFHGKLYPELSYCVGSRHVWQSSTFDILLSWKKRVMKSPTCNVSKHENKGRNCIVYV